jgi:hypothetical protein
MPKVILNPLDLRQMRAERTSGYYIMAYSGDVYYPIREVLRATEENARVISAFARAFKHRCLDDVASQMELKPGALDALRVIPYNSAPVLDQVMLQRIEQRLIETDNQLGNWMRFFLQIVQNGYHLFSRDNPKINPNPDLLDCSSYAVQDIIPTKAAQFIFEQKALFKQMYMHLAMACTNPDTPDHSRRPVDTFALRT